MTQAEIESKTTPELARLHNQVYGKDPDLAARISQVMISRFSEAG